MYTTRWLISKWFLTDCPTVPTNRTTADPLHLCIHEQAILIASTYPFHHGCLAFAMPPKKLLKKPPGKPRSALPTGSRTSALLSSSVLPFPVFLMTLSSRFSASSSAASSRCLNLQWEKSGTLNTRFFRGCYFVYKGKELPTIENRVMPPRLVSVGSNLL
jgi:hypothetical protein